jgi:hypothetical protein
LYTSRTVRLERFREGLCYYWPGDAQRKGREPLLVRLVRVCGKKRVRGKTQRHDVWLMTNVRSKRRLSVEMAGQFYRWRWENEGLFRTYKRTLAKVKLLSRKVALVHREAEGSMLATQLLLAQGAWGLRPAARTAQVACSPRKVLLAIREEMQALLPARRSRLGQRLAEARRERRPRRRSSKVKRDWPRRKPAKPPGAPKILKLNREQKLLIHQLKTGKKVG